MSRCVETTNSSRDRGSVLRRAIALWCMSGGFPGQTLGRQGFTRREDTKSGLGFVVNLRRIKMCASLRNCACRFIPTFQFRPDNFPEKTCMRDTAKLTVSAQHVITRVSRYGK